MSKVIYTKESKQNLLTYLEQKEKNKNLGLKIGAEDIDNFLVPLSSSDMMVVLARPSNGKTSWMIHYAMQAGKSVMLDKQNGITEYAPPIYITAETPTEELSLKVLSNFMHLDSRFIRAGSEELDWQHVKNEVSAMYSEVPLLYSGHSIVNPRRGLMTIDLIEQSVYDVCDRTGLPPRLILVDYLQRIASPGNSDRRLGLSEVVERLKDLHMSVGCPIIFGSQAKREVDDRPFPVPQAGDGKETGSIEETADVVISLMRPCKYWSVGSEIPKTSPPRVVTENLFFVNVLKQRNGLSDQGFWMNFDMSVTHLSEMEEIN